MFGDQYVQKTLEPRIAIDQQGDAREDQQAEELIHELGPYSNDSASDNDGNECAAVESECSIVDETVRASSIKMRTRSKARRSLVILEPNFCSDVEDDEPRPRQRKRNPVIATMPRALNFFPFESLIFFSSPFAHAAEHRTSKLRRGYGRRPKALKAA